MLGSLKNSQGLVGLSSFVSLQSNYYKQTKKKRKRVRGDYHHYTAETRAKIAKYARESGNKAVVKKYSVELDHPVSEGTVRNFKRKYFEQLKSVTDPYLITSLPSAVQFLLFRTNVMQ